MRTMSIYYKKRKAELMKFPLRHFIIELSTEIEHAFSSTIAYLLKIENREQSKCFGYTSSALSLSQKVNILQDIVGKDNVDSKFVEGFMYIRNKFAHVFEIRTLEDFVAKASDGKTWVRKLKTRYDLPKLDNDKDFKNALFEMFIDINYFTIDIVLSHSLDLSSEHIAIDKYAAIAKQILKQFGKRPSKTVVVTEQLKELFEYFISKTSNEKTNFSVNGI